MRHKDSVRSGAGKQVEVGTVGSCGTLAGQRRRAKQELSWGEVFDGVHDPVADRAVPERCEAGIPSEERERAAVVTSRKAKRSHRVLLRSSASSVPEQQSAAPSAAALQRRQRIRPSSLRLVPQNQCGTHDPAGDSPLDKNQCLIMVPPHPFLVSGGPRSVPCAACHFAN
jgi:hypothetical protein